MRRIWCEAREHREDRQAQMVDWNDEDAVIDGSITKVFGAILENTA